MLDFFKDYIEIGTLLISLVVSFVLETYIFFRKSEFKPSGYTKKAIIGASTLILSTLFFISINAFEILPNKNIEQEWILISFILSLLLAFFSVLGLRKDEKFFIANNNQELAFEIDEILEEFIKSGKSFTSSSSRDLEILAFLRKLCFSISEKFEDLFEDGFIKFDLVPNQETDPTKKGFRSRTEHELSSFIKDQIVSGFPDLSSNILLDVDDKDNYTEFVGESRWIIDAIDGSTHLVNNIPLYGCSICLQKKIDNKWETEIGVSFFHKTKEFFFAFKNKLSSQPNAFLNNWIPLQQKRNEKRPLLNRRTYEKDIISNSIFYLEFPGNKTKLKLEKYNKNDEALSVYDDISSLLKFTCKSASKVRGFNMGSFGISYVAKGSFDAYISIPGTTSPFDSYASLFIAEMSGLKIIQKEGVIKNEEANFDLGSRIFVSSQKVYNELVNSTSQSEFKKFLNTLFDDQFK